MIKTQPGFKQSALMMAMLGTLVSAPVLADQGGSFFKDSNTKFNLRYRYETVDQDGKDKDAKASTLKARITWQSGKVNNFSVKGEVDHVATVGADDYNDASGVNAKTEYPVVADPEGTDLNQLYVNYDDDSLSLTAGRQRIVHGNQRFVGGVAWRQNEQTYDGVRAEFKANDKFSVDYAYVTKVRRIFGPDGPKKELKGDLHLANAHFTINEKHKLTGFGYFLDFDGSIDSHDTLGVDYMGKLGSFALHASAATQSFDQYDASYFALDGTVKLAGVKVTLGVEQLGSDNGQYAFSTPLATAHKFQGFADKFLATPADGVRDYFVKVAGKVGPVKLAAIYHDFNSVEKSADLGCELNLVASYKVHKTTTLVAKYAGYDAKDHGTDTDKLWLMANMVF